MSYFIAQHGWRWSYTVLAAPLRRMATGMFLGAASYLVVAAIQSRLESGAQLCVLLQLVPYLILTLAETGRIPVDNPDTHLELTMLHEGMLLEHSGPGLACIVLATHLKQLVVISLVAALFLPLGLARGFGPAELGLALCAFAAKALALAAFLTLVESSYAKLRFFRVPQFLGLGFVCAFLALALRVL